MSRTKMAVRVLIVMMAVWGSSQASAQRRSKDVGGMTNGTSGLSVGAVDNGSRGSSRRSSSSSSSSRNGTTQNPQPGTTNAAGAASNAAGRSATASSSTGRPGMRTTASSTKGTTSTRTLGKPTTPGGGQPGKPGGNKTGYGAQGQMREITREMAESLRPVRVDYDAEAMAEKPGVIILGTRRYRADSAAKPKGKSTRSFESSGRSTDLVRPL